MNGVTLIGGRSGRVDDRSDLAEETQVLHVMQSALSCRNGWAGHGASSKS